MKSDWLTQGPLVEKFEQSISTYCKSRFGISVNSGTSALHISCLALDLGPGDILWTSPNTYVSSANCALFCGAKIDFVDIDTRTYNMSVKALEAKLVIAEQTGTLPKILIAVHFSGQSSEMKAMKDLADKYKFKIIEDASHAIGGKYLGENIGCCRYSDISIFSFHAIKIMTTGEGGMVLTNSSRLATKIQCLRSNGITRDPELTDIQNNGISDYAR